MLLASGWLALATACDGEVPLPDEELALRVTVDADEVELGRAFPLTVVRVWSKDLVPEEWSDEVLAPLAVQLAETTRREDARHVEETRRFLCYAFSLEDVTVAAPSFRARVRNGGGERVVSAAPLEIRVKPALDRAAPGPIELPGEPLEEPDPQSRRWGLWAGALAALALLMWYLRRRLRRPSAAEPAEEPPVPPVPPPHLRALERLERLRRQRPHGREEIQAFYGEASALVREYLLERFAVCLPPMTTEEFLTAPRTTRVLEAVQRAMLAGFLGQCDLVKFACLSPDDPQREKLLGSAEEFVLETRTNGEPGGPEEGA